MSLPSQTVDGVNALIISQLEASLGQAIPIAPKAALRVLAKVLAAVFILLWKYAGSIFLNLFVAYASDQPTTVNGKVIVPLLELGRQYGAGDPEPSTQAQLLVQVTVRNQIGSLPAFSFLLFPSTGVIYQTVAEVALNAPTVPVTIRATSDQSGGDGSGAIGNLQPGDVVEFSSPLPNISGKATVLSQVVAGADAEKTDSYRARIAARRQSPPQGGAYADYQQWALDTPGIINVYPYTGNPGIVDVYCEADPISSGSPDGIATSPQLAAVLDSINLNASGVATRRPANAAPNPLPITRTGFTVTITGFYLLLPTTQASVQSGVDEYLRSREPFIAGLSALPSTNRITQTAVAGVIETIVEATGESVASVTMTPGPIYDLHNGEKAKLTAIVGA